MIRRSDTIVQGDGITLESGVYVRVKTSTGALATLYDDLGNVLANPVVSNGSGVFTYNVPANAGGTYTEEFCFTPTGAARTVANVLLAQDVDSTVMPAVSEIALYAAISDPTDRFTAQLLSMVSAHSLVGLWPISNYSATPTPCIRNRMGSASPSSNFFRGSRRVFTDATLWKKTNVTMTDLAATGWDGTSDASTLAGTGAWSLTNFYNNPLVAVGTWTIACNVKRDAGTDQVFAFSKDGGVTVSAVKTATSAWQRFTYTFVLAATAAPVQIGLFSSDGATAANLQIMDLELFPGSADLGPVGADTHIYLGQLPGLNSGSYAAGVLQPTLGIVQFPAALDFSQGFTAQFCAEVTVSGYNCVLSDIKDTNNFPLATMGGLGPMGLSNSTSISNQNGTGGVGQTQVFQYQDLYNLIGQGVHVFTYRYDPVGQAGSGVLEIWLDDIRMFRQERVYTRSARGFVFGNISFNAGPGANKHSGFTALWTRALSDNEVRASFSAQKVRAASSGVLVRGDSANRILAVEGDSRSGGNGELCYPFQYGAHDSPVVFGSVWAIVGSKIGDLELRAPRVDAMIPPVKNSRKFIYTALIGVNDLQTYPGATDTIAATDYATRLAAIFDARRAAGWKVVGITELPNLNGTYNTRRNILNGIIRTWVGTHIDALADFGADATMGPDAAAADTSLFSDGVHPTAAGHLLLEPIYRAAVNSL